MADSIDGASGHVTESHMSSTRRRFFGARWYTQRDQFVQISAFEQHDPSCVQHTRTSSRTQGYLYWDHNQLARVTRQAQHRRLTVHKDAVYTVHSIPVAEDVAHPLFTSAACRTGNQWLRCSELERSSTSEELAAVDYRLHIALFYLAYAVSYG